jgi:hypothetical protein
MRKLIFVALLGLGLFGLWSQSPNLSAAPATSGYILAQVAPASTPDNTRPLSDAKCTGSTDGGSLLGFPTWYKYLCTSKDASGSTTVALTDVSDVWLVVLAIIEFLTRLAVLLSIGLVIRGGIKMLMSQGEPEKIASSRSIIINSLIGLAITIVATGLVNFVGRQFGA